MHRKTVYSAPRRGDAENQGPSSPKREWVGGRGPGEGGSLRSHCSCVPLRLCVSAVKWVFLACTALALGFSQARPPAPRIDVEQYTIDAEIAPNAPRWPPRPPCASCPLATTSPRPPSS